MIKNAVLHPAGEQPMMVDVVARPRGSDAILWCTNLRTIDGRRLPSVANPEALCIIPLSTLRFVELPVDQATIDEIVAEAESGPAAGGPAGRRKRAAAISAGRDEGPTAADLAADDEASEELLRRIREI